jgi:peptidoglycan-associated lipoprotein
MHMVKTVPTGGHAKRTRLCAPLLLAILPQLTACQRPTQPLPVPPQFSVSPAVLAASTARPPIPPLVAEKPEFVPFSGSTVIYFQGDSTRLDPEARSILDQQADWMLLYPQVIALVAGHTDLSGSRGRQFAIGEMRAATMRNYLVALGVSPTRIRVTSFGKQLPVAKSRDEESQRLNRRGQTFFAVIPALSEN